jgi:hypothetical protein
MFNTILKPEPGKLEYWYVILRELAHESTQLGADPKRYILVSSILGLKLVTWLI